MKFFFPELGSCFGGALVTPATATETVAASATEVPSNRRRMAQSHSGKHWRPGLSAIAEDGGVLVASRERSESAVVRSVKKPVCKPKPSSNYRSDSYGEDYRKSAHPLALPAFSPTPFLF